jgi:hypothetical protein
VVGDRPRDEGGGAELLVPTFEGRLLGPGDASTRGVSNLEHRRPNIQVFPIGKVVAPSKYRSHAYYIKRGRGAMMGG